jgi:hypothetical protein
VPFKFGPWRWWKLRRARSRRARRNIERRIAAAIKERERLNRELMGMKSGFEKSMKLASYWQTCTAIDALNRELSEA